MPDPTRLPGGAPCALGAIELRDRLRSGELAAEAAARSCLERVAAVDDRVQAWAFLDPELVLAQARALDRRLAAGEPCGPLHGVPVGIKDIIDTADMPTENGTVLHAGRRPAADAAVVAKLRAAGALVFGKTVTTELATYAPGKTRNPHDPAHTPGGSSSGSAAAVASFMVPLALGTQTNGSVIRPAAFCGVVGYKPTFGLIPRDGVLCQSPALDQVGVIARSVADAALLAAALCEPSRTKHWLDAPLAQAPKIAFVRTAIWDRADADARDTILALVRRLGAAVAEVPMPAEAAAVWDWQKTVMETEIAANYAAEWAAGRDRLSSSLRSQIERGRATPEADYRQALAEIEPVNAAFAPLFGDHDVILTPAVPGTAPRGLDSTGDPAFCTLWTFCGMPALTLPLLRGANGLPLGVQLVAPRGGDARLLRAARWLQDAIH